MVEEFIGQDEFLQQAPPQQRQPQSLASIAATGVFAGRALSSQFRDKTDQLATKGLAEASKLTAKMSENMLKVSTNAAKVDGKMTGMAKSAGMTGKALGSASKTLGRMAQNVGKFSKGFEKIGKGAEKALIGGLFAKGMGGRLKAIGGGMASIAAGLALVAQAALRVLPVLGPIAAVLVVIMATIKLVKFTVRLFSDEIKAMKEQALEPWRDAFGDIGNALRRTLAPAVAFVMLIIKGFFALVKVVGEGVKAIFGSMSDGASSALESMTNGFAVAIEFILKMLQPFVDGFVKAFNLIIVLFNVFKDSSTTMGQKFAIVLQLIIGVLVDFAKKLVDIWAGALKIVIKIVEMALNGLLYVWKKVFDLLNKMTGGVLGKVMNVIFAFGKGVVDVFGAIFEGIMDTIAWVIDKLAGIVSQINDWDFLGIVPDHWNDDLNALADTLRGVGDVGDVFTEKIKGVMDTLQGLLNAEDIGSFSDFLESEFAVSLDGITKFVDIGRDKMKELLDSFKGKFGLDLEEFAAEQGIDLLNSPDLVGEFRKLLAQAKIKIEDDNLNRGLEDLGEKVSKVNDKDIKIEINPFIQIHIEGVEDPEEVRRIAMEAVDEGLAKAGADLASQANAGAL